MATAHARLQSDTNAAGAGANSGMQCPHELSSPPSSPSKNAAILSPTNLARLAPATSKRKRKADDEDEGENKNENENSLPTGAQRRVLMHVQIRPQTHPHRRATIAVHTGRRLSMIVPERRTDSLEVEAGGESSPRARVADRFQSLALEAGYFAADSARETDGESSPPESSPPGRKHSEDGPLHKRMRRDDDDDHSNYPHDQPQVIITKDGRIITDPLRASLTWQDDEITVYDPNDTDDDGTGVNGIGFKPPPAIAYDRMLKRRQQMAAYRKREECEARARRSLLRTRAYQVADGTAADTGLASAEAEPDEATARATALEVSLRTPRSHPAVTAEESFTSSPPATPSPSPVRRVRFLETGPVTIRFTEPDAVPVVPSILSS
ncbi:hypothetical protein SEPCBS119000_003883 [Sporothrix epigloea]|uniref:Uncharacterized protein n=1 Tax=Sporothrix epigloea TaxID=1892477 RepID=A0ABP0DP34_9PEZI